MSKKQETTGTQLTLFSPKFGDRFLTDHAGSIINDPKIAIVEMIANCWDAGADTVEITWFPSDKHYIEIKDNGTGMTSQEFEERWLELNYNRRDAQGENVLFPRSNRSSNRKVFGINGKGRHGMFYFTDEYYIETRKDGWNNQFQINRALGSSKTPFQVISIDNTPTSKEEHGTRLWANTFKKDFGEEELRNLIGSKFISDPSFRIFVNGHEVELTDLSHLFNQEEFPVDGLGNVSVLLFDTESISKSTKQHGVAWWVNNRLVGNISWSKLNGEKYLDGRISKAKRYTFVVKADILHDQVLSDWTGFNPNTVKTQTVATVVERYITQKLYQIFLSTYKDRKKHAIEENTGTLSDLSPVSRWQIGQFLDEIQMKCHNIKVEHLTDAVEVLSKLEQSRSGYTLLKQLAQLNPDDFDSLNSILSQWTVQEAKTVLDELYKRLTLIKQLEVLVESPSTDELHDLQPLFERGLWIFGPEYESVEFMSNRSLSSVIKYLFRDTLSKVKLSTPRRRPDFIVLPDSSIGVYSCDEYDAQGEVCSIGKVLIIELKKGGFDLSKKEIRQAEDYVFELRKSGKVSNKAHIIAFVLGAKLGEDARDPKKSGDPENTFIYPRAYSTVLRQAHARIFNLTEKLKQINQEHIGGFIDIEVEKILQNSRIQSSLSFN